ncbi:MAG: RNA polymerase sigma factor RpoH [Alphaproteobacteria bacterium GM202ARS2]|nr:RNA polymerase sigma factor RpoH [Alphaproteobacteria bacterium GM202ARS2]
MTSFPLIVDSEGGLGGYLRRINRVPILTKQEECRLARRWIESRDTDAAHKLVIAHLRLVARVALKYRNYGLPISDLISEGNIGLMRAVKRFDPDLGFRLSTYAMWWVRASITEYVLSSWSLVRAGTAAARKRLFFGLKRIKSKLHIFDKSDLSEKQVALISQELQVSQEDVIDMNRRLTQGDMSLNTLVHDENEAVEFVDVLPDDTPNAEEQITEQNELTHQRAILKKAMGSLTQRERNILEERHIKEEPKTLQDLARQHNISRERVRQIELGALRKIKRRALEEMRRNTLAHAH